MESSLAASHQTPGPHTRDSSWLWDWGDWGSGRDVNEILASPPRHKPFRFIGQAPQSKADTHEHLAYECVGACQQPPQPLPFKWPFLGPRQCVASETASLPVIVSMKEGGRPRPQVVSLPNMRVQKCSCSWDGAPVPRKLEP